MQASARSRDNHALEYAIHLANHRSEPLTVFFALTADYPGANLRHYWFLLQGLQDTAARLAERGVPFAVFLGDPAAVATRVAGTVATVVTDRGYTRVQREWRRQLAAAADCPVVQVESNVVVPVETASGKEEWSAATLRRKITPLLETYLAPVTPQRYHARDTRGTPDDPLSSLDLPRLTLNTITAPEHLTRVMAVDTSVGPVDAFTGGESSAERRLAQFLDERLAYYADRRNVPDLGWVSNLSPYLHFGHISPVTIVLRAREHFEHAGGHARQEDLDGFIEELVVRRELAANFTEYNDSYDRYDGLPDWARRTLEEHSTDERPTVYSLEELEEARTDDPYWNACQREMVDHGKMHNYMRMYWGKKILEWTDSPRDAHARAVYLNDKYELDGRDPNGYAGVAWCFGKHDRPWVERPIFGSVRYMNANGLRRKFKNIQQYVDRWTS